MLIITSKLPWRRRPAGIARLNFAHPLARGLIVYGYAFENLFVNLAREIGGDGADENSRSGFTLYNNNENTLLHRNVNTGLITLNNAQIVENLTQFTAIGSINLLSGTMNTMIGAGIDNTTRLNLLMLYSGDCRTYIGNNYGYLTTTLSQLSQYSFVFDGSKTGNTNRLILYVDGILTALSYSGTIPSTTQSSLSNIYIGKAITSVSSNGIGYISEPILYNIALDSNEIKALYENPYQVLVPTLSRRYFIPLGVSQTLEITSGNETGTGIVLTVTQPRSIAVTDSTETGTGYAVDITQPRSIAVTTGDDAGVGYVLGITQPRSIAVTDGSETGTGEALGLLQPRSVVVVEGEETGIGYALDISTGGSRSLTVEAGTGADIGYALNRLQPRSIGLTAGTETGVGYAVDIPLPGPVLAIEPGDELCFGYACNVIQHGRKYRYPRPTKAIHTRHYTSRL